MPAKQAAIATLCTPLNKKICPIFMSAARVRRCRPLHFCRWNDSLFIGISECVILCGIYIAFFKQLHLVAC
jgi:hypothetical protein